MAGQVRLRDQFAALERAMRDWELVDSDRFSFEDSDRFEEDSLCSWISEPESLCNNWRGWKKSNFSPNGNPVQNSTGIAASVGGQGTSSVTTVKDVGVVGGIGLMGNNLKFPSSLNSLGSTQGSGPQLNLVELAAKLVASHIPFEMVERFYPPVPEQLQLRIAFWSFPEHEEDIRLYSCLANGSAEEFQKGERLFRNDSVSDILQIGFHLSATVKPNVREAHKVAVTFDRRRVTSCTCTCNASTNWCGHVVAVCLHRIFQSKDVMLRAPVSESLSRLHRDQLQKFAQYLISELPQQILPTAQRLLDELLSSQRSAINTLRGAPDPTAGASANEQTSWYLDERTLHGNIHKILIKFCVPAPIVFSDVNYLSSAAPPASAEWSSLLRPLRGREPEGMWNLLSIVREMFRREDRNAVPLLEIITEECLNCDQILVWWFNTKVALHNGNSGHGAKHHSVNSNAHACQHAGSSLCDEIVFLWRLAALNPGLTPDERCILHNQFKEWHLKIIDKVAKSRNASVGSKHANSFKNDVEVFPGFRPSIEACYLNWDNYPIPGITYSESNLLYRCPFMCFRHSDGHSRSGETGMIHSSHAILNNPAGEHHLLHSSATISSVPLSSSKRPRSVDFVGAEKNQPSTSSVQNPSVGNNPGPSTAGTSSSKVTGKSGKGGKKQQLLLQQQREALAAAVAATTLPAMQEFSPILPVGASGLKIKANRQASLEQSSSFDDEIPGPSSSSGGERSMYISASASTSTSAAASSSAGPTGATTTASTTCVEVVTTRGVPLRLAVGEAIVSSSHRDGNRSSVSSEGFCENEVEGEVEVDGDLLKDEGVEIFEAKSDPPLTLSMNTSDELENEGDVDLDADSDSSAKSSSIEQRDRKATDSDTDENLRRGVKSKILSGSSSTNGVPKFDSSDSQQSGDEYHLYYYDPKAPVASNGGKSRENGDENSKKDPLGLNPFGNLKKIEDAWEILFARAEGLHAHGHSKDACVLGVKLAGELLANPPDLTLDPPTAPTGKGKKRKINPASHQISCLASATLAKCGFLCTVLAENPEYYYLAFQVGMFGLELCRPPASTKPLEVKLANQEAELAQLLKRIYSCHFSSAIYDDIRQKAENLRDGKFKSRGDALLPLVLANFIFDSLVMPSNREGRCSIAGAYHLPTDESLGASPWVKGHTGQDTHLKSTQDRTLDMDRTLGFEAAVAALGLKANVSEADHPLLCEGTRRQRGDLALSMLLHYKDDPEKLAKVMDKLLDREIHQLYKAPLPSAYYSNNPPTTTLLGSHWGNKNETATTMTSVTASTAVSGEREASPTVGAGGSSSSSSSSSTNNLASSRTNNIGNVSSPNNSPPPQLKSPVVNAIVDRSSPPTSHHHHHHHESTVGANVVHEKSTSNSSSSSSATATSTIQTKPSPPSGGEVESLTSLLRATCPVGGSATGNSTINSNNSNKNGLSSSSSNSNSTASTSPQQHPPFDSQSAFSAGSSSSPSSISPPNGTNVNNGGSGSGSTNSTTSTVPPVSTPTACSTQVTSVTASTVTTTATTTTANNSTTTNGTTTKSGRESGRFKGKRSYPVLPNQPSEAGAHFMFELSKIVLGKAGGSSNQSLFTQPSTGQNPRGPHRALHMCAFHIGLYALGLHNAVSPNWLSRTYSSHVSWITGQAMEIGAPAIAFLIDTWDSHLTPPEAVTIADRASRGDVNMVRAAAELALSCLPYAHALNPNEIHRAILQCKEQSDGMLEKACITVESAAKGGGVYPEVLFDVARQWYSLYQKHLPLDVDLLNDELNHHDSLLSLDGNIDSMNSHVSAQTGLPPVNPNNPPLPPPSVSSSGPTQNPCSMEMVHGMPPNQMPHGHQQVYPIATPPMASLPYATAPYGQVPFIPATFNPVPVPGNFVYGQTVIYQASANNPGVSTTASGYYNQQQNQQQPTQSYHPAPPNLHQQQLHNMGPALQYYPSVTPITSAGPSPHLRPTAQYFPVSHMSLHPSSMNPQMPPPNNSGVTAAMVAAATGHSHVQHGHPMNLTNQGHLVAIQNGGQSNGQSMAMAANMAANNSHAAAVAAHAHNMNQIANGRPPGQPQVILVNMNGTPLMSHGGSNFVQGNSMTSQAPNGQHHNNMNHIGMQDGPPTSSSSQIRPVFFPHGGGREGPLTGGQQGGQASAIKVKYLLASYRVGMLAMETLARRVHDDRPAAKFARNPPYGEDVKWLLGISRKLGAQYLQQFCICAVSSIANPFVLHEIILDAALISTRNNLAWVYQNPRSPLAPLVQKCQQMYFQCLHQKLYHITLSDYEDFINIVCTARQAFHLTPDGISQFKEWLQNLRRSKACKKELWTQITSALQSNPK